MSSGLVRACVGATPDRMKPANTAPALTGSRVSFRAPPTRIGDNYRSNAARGANNFCCPIHPGNSPGFKCDTCSCAGRRQREGCAAWRILFALESSLATPRRVAAGFPACRAPAMPAETPAAAAEISRVFEDSARSTRGYERERLDFFGARVGFGLGGGGDRKSGRSA